MTYTDLQEALRVLELKERTTLKEINWCGVGNRRVSPGILLFRFFMKKNL